jgi:hypothetical protein
MADIWQKFIHLKDKVYQGSEFKIEDELIGEREDEAFNWVNAWKIEDGEWIK